jgi:hypothetical protein
MANTVLVAGSGSFTVTGISAVLCSEGPRMRYNIEDIEDQLLATIAANSTLSSVNRDTHAGQVDQQMFLDPSYVGGLIHLCPFVYVQYLGRETPQADMDSTWSDQIHTVRFRFYVGAQSLRTRKESQRAAYALLRALYDAIHGKVPNPSPAITGVATLSGTSITTTGFCPQSPFGPAGGIDEIMILLEKNICVYQTDYSVRLLA